MTSTDYATERPEGATAEFGLTVGGKTLAGSYTQSERPVEYDYPYDEGLTYERCRIGDWDIAIEGDSGYKSIEVAVAMTNRLHDTFLSLPDKRRVFTNLHLFRFFRHTDAGQMTVDLDCTLDNCFTRSTVKTPTGTVGHIYFPPTPRT